MQKPDIKTTRDLTTLVDSFYQKVKSDSLLSPMFAHVNWDTHLPIMYGFWGSLLLGAGTYKGNPLRRHISLPITKEHFNRWLEIFQETVNEHFMGAKAEEANVRAKAIADVFQHKMGLLNTQTKSYTTKL